MLSITGNLSICDNKNLPSYEKNYYKGMRHKWEFVDDMFQGRDAWVSVNDNSGVEYNVGATSYTDGEMIDGGYVSATTQGSQKSAGAPPSNIPSAAKKNYIVQNFDSTDSEIFVVAVTNIGSADGTARVSLQWREIY